MSGAGISAGVYCTLRYCCAQNGCMVDALRQASEALSEALSEGELLFGEGLGLEEPLKLALSAAMSAESPQTTLSTFQMRSMPSR